MMTNGFLRMRPMFVLIALLLLVGSGLAWANAADDESNDKTVSQLQVTKIVDNTEQKAGKTVKFTVTIRNNGDETATLTLVDIMPDQMTLLPATVDAPANFEGGLTDSVSASVDTLTWEGRMFSGGQIVMTYEAMIDETAQVDDVLTNEAAVTSLDGTSTTVSASVTVSRFTNGLPFLFLPMLSWAGPPGLCYQEQDKVVVLDITRQRPNGWEYIVDDGAIIEGYYRWPGSDYGIGGFGTLDYIIRIDNPGRYYMRMHSYANHPSESDKSNDMFMSVEGEPWEKTVAWSYQWKEWGWATGHELHGGRTPFWEFPTAGEYEFKLSARSNQFGIDRMTFYQSDALGFSEPADHHRNSTVRNQINNTLDDLPTSNLCVGYTPPTFDR